jgi:DNA-directed RNA polymerase subunit H (RpoH/RPB5)
MSDIRKNTLLMLSRRGYDVTIVESKDDYFRLPKVLVVFIEDAKVSVGTMKTIMSIRENDDELIIIVHSKTLTSDAKKIAKGPLIETFEYDEMAFDLLEVVPKHEKVSERPKDWKRFPIIRKTDAVCKYYNFKQKDVIKIENDDSTIEYRRVC